MNKVLFSLIWIQFLSLHVVFAFNSQDSDTIYFVNEKNKIDKDVGDSEVLKKILNDCKSNSVIYFEAGTYYLSQTIKINKSIEICGALEDSVLLIFDLKGKGNLIEVSGTLSKSVYPVNMKSNSFSCYPKEIPHVNMGNHVLLYKTNADIELSSWAKNSIGQLFEVAAHKGDSLQFTESSSLEYEASDSSKLQMVNPTNHVIFRNLTIQRKDQTKYQTSHLLFQYAVNCLVEKVTFLKMNFAAIDISYSKNIKIKSCNFYDAFSHGNGGKAYGVALQYTSSFCVVNDCIFRKLRHAVLLQSGANHCTVSGNYIVEGFWEEVNLPQSAAGDIVLHGNYPYANKIVGNICNNIVVDRSHGLNGPYNQITNNRTNLYGIFVQRNGVEKILIANNDIYKVGLLKGKIRGRKSMMVLRNNRKNGRSYLVRSEVSETDCNDKLSVFNDYHIGYPCEFNNYFNRAYFRYNTTSISHYN